MRGGLAGLIATLGSRSRWAAAKPRGAAAQSCIFVFLRGGPSQIDTWDPKPGRETGGPIKAIATRTAGLQFSEHLPRLAELSEMVTVVRSLYGTETNHDAAVHRLHTSHPIEAGATHAPIGSLAARDLGDGVMPGYVTIGGRGHPAGVVGARYMPFEVVNPRNAMRDLRRFPGVKKDRFARRAQVWRALEDRHLARNPGDPRLLDQRHQWEQAMALMGSDLISAFDLTKEDARVREAYGSSRFAESCLLARRLVEVGVPFVEVVMSGWDTHEDNYRRTEVLARELDGGLSVLLEDLRSRGLLEHTLVLCAGEFGRSPKINAKGGRDHYPKAFSAVLAGAGVPGGQVVGSTCEDGIEITERPVSVVDLVRTVAVKLGLDPDETLISSAGRPVTAIGGGAVVAELG